MAPRQPPSGAGGHASGRRRRLLSELQSIPSSCPPAKTTWKTGLVQRYTTEINMAKIESVDVSQSILGRVFDFGTLTIRGTGETIEALRNIASPLQFRNAIMVR